MDDKTYQRIMRITGRTYCGNDACVPEAKTVRYVSSEGCERVIASNNDGYELWLGSPTKWDCYLSQGEVRLLLRWIVIDWYAKARWFGIRRPIYYWALSKHVDAWRAERQAQS